MVKKSRKILRRILVCLLAVALITPTGLISTKTAYADTVTSVKPPVLSKTSYRYLLVGESYDFNILNKIAGSAYKWTSSDAKIATVNQSGLVKAKKAGTATISCAITTGSMTYQLVATVYVKNSVNVPAKKISIVNKVQSLFIGDEYNLNKSFEPISSKDFVNWTSSNTNVATVDKNGIVKGLAEGTVKITATTSTGASDSVTIKVSAATTVSDQSSLEKALKSALATSIEIKTDKEMEFNIPEGNYSDKSLFVNAPNATVNNHGVFKEIVIKALKGDSWHEYAQGNSIVVEAGTTRIVIEESAAASVHVTKSGSDVIFDIKGDVDIFVEASGNIIIRGASGTVPNVNVLSDNATIKTDLALNINASQKARLILNTSEASKTKVKADSDDATPEVQGNGFITLEVDGKTKVLTPPSSTPSGSSGSSDTSTPGSGTTPRIPDKVTAKFGSPVIDGEMDSIWYNADVVIPKVSGSTTEVTATYRMLWDDNALYILADIKDQTLDKSSTNAYEQDSMELFLDELYDKGTAYKADDLHYRVNYDNMRSTDAGDKTRFYSQTKLTSDGYLVEACITWDKVTPANNTELGFDLQINEAQSGRRLTTVTIFDTTGNAYQNPSLFGKLVLLGKRTSSVTGTNPYNLLSYIDTIKEIYLDAYINKDIIEEPLAEATSIALDPTSTQAEVNSAFAALKAAVDALDDGSGYTKPSALPEVADLPNIFTMRDGTQVTTLEQWNLRKEEISDMYQYYMYGIYPDSSTENVTFEDIPPHVEYVFDWATWTMKEVIVPGPNQKQVRINIEKGGKTASFNATFTFPSTTVGEEVTITPPTQPGGYPVLIVIGSLGAKQKKYLNDNGYAVAEFNTGSVAADNYTRTGAFYDIYPYGMTYQEQTGVLMAWAWGVSKIIDVIELDAAGSNVLQISPVNTIVTGVSRNGKAAAVAGAFDSRIKVTAPGSSGAGGLAMFRYNSSGMVDDYSSLEREEFIDFDGNASKWDNYQANPLHTIGTNESLSNIQSGSEGHWFNDIFQGFTSPDQLPFDQYYLAALASGEDRYYYITAEVDGSDWINSKGMYATYLAAQRMYDSLGLSDHIGIHLHATGHDFTLEDTKYLVEFCNKNFYNQIDGRKDLDHLKTSLYELPVNYDPYFDTLKNLPFPDLTSTLYNEGFESGSTGLVTAVTGAAIQAVDLGGKKALKVTQSVDDVFIIVPLINSVSGSAITVSGSAITVTGSAISAVSGAAILISADVLYDEEATAPVVFELGLLTGGDATTTLGISTESVLGQNRYKWVNLKGTYTLTGDNVYLYIKGSGVSNYYIDNIKIK